MSCSSREYSPDWLRNFEAPQKESIVALSSSSESIPDNNAVNEDEEDDDQLFIKSVMQKNQEVKSPSKKQSTKSSLAKNTKEKNLSEREGECLYHVTDILYAPDNNAVNEDEEDDDQLFIKSVMQKNPEVKSPSKKQSTKSSLAKNTKEKNLSEREGSSTDGKFAKRKTPRKPSKPQEPKSSVWMLSSDSESCPDASALMEDDLRHFELSEQEAGQHPKEEDILDTAGESLLKGVSKFETPKKRLKIEDMVPTKTKEKTPTRQENDGDIKVAKGETTEKQTGPYVSSSRLPLVLADKVQRTKALVECEGESIDLSGDLGSVGRVVISDSPSGDPDMFLDLKGTMYKTTIVPSRTFCVVSFGQSEAKIEAIMNDFIQLKPQSNVDEAETMVEGTLEGFSFDSEDENDNPTARQTDENEGADQQTNGHGGGKTSGAKRKKGKTAAKKPAKKVKRKAPVSKKTKTKK